MHVSLAFDPWPWYMYVWCIHLLSVILTHVCMMHVFMMRHICHACTNLDSDAYIHYACMYYAYTYAPWSCMHDAYTYAPWSWCICAWCIHLWYSILDYAACVYDAAEILWPTNQCVTRPKIWTIPIPRLFFGTKFFRDWFRDFLRYQNFSRPVPRLFLVPNFFETGSDTIKKLQKSRERVETGTQINTNILKKFETGSDIFFR